MRTQVREYQYLPAQKAAAKGNVPVRYFVWVGLAWVGLGWLGLAWLGLAWVGLAWLGLALLCFALLCFALLCFALLCFALPLTGAGLPPKASCLFVGQGIKQEGRVYLDPKVLGRREGRRRKVAWSEKFAVRHGS